VTTHRLRPLVSAALESQHIHLAAMEWQRSWRIARSIGQNLHVLQRNLRPYPRPFVVMGLSHALCSGTHQMAATVH